MARVSVDRNLERNLVRSQQVRPMLEQKSEAVARRARELAPDDPATVGEDLRDSIEAEVGLEGDTMVGRVRANDWKAHLWEFGHRAPNGTSREKPFLRPAADAEGLTVENRRGGR